MNNILDREFHFNNNNKRTKENVYTATVDLIKGLIKSELDSVISDI